MTSFVAFLVAGVAAAWDPAVTGSAGAGAFSPLAQIASVIALAAVLCPSWFWRGDFREKSRAYVPGILITPDFFFSNVDWKSCSSANSEVAGQRTVVLQIRSAVIDQDDASRAILGNTSRSEWRTGLMRSTSMRQKLMPSYRLKSKY